MSDSKCPLLIPGDDIVWINTPNWSSFMSGDTVKECYYTLSASMTLCDIKLNEDGNYYAILHFPVNDGEPRVVYGQELAKLQVYVVEKYEKFVLKLFN